MPMPEFNDGQILYAAPLNEVADEVDALRTDKVDKTTTVNGHALSGNITVTKANVGLGNVDNTSDANKPVSTAQQTALDGKANTVHGHALTDSNITGVLPIAQVPTGTTSTTVSLGNHTHTTEQVTDFNTAADARVNSLVPAASTTASGKVELATNAETQTGTDAVRAVTPAGLASVVGTLGVYADYTPAITASSGSPAVGTGGFSKGRYTQIGKMVSAEINIYFAGTGAGASGGSGTMYFSLPVPARIMNGTGSNDYDMQAVGSGIRGNASSVVGLVRAGNNTVFAVRDYTGGAMLGTNISTSATWLRMSLNYEAA